MSGKKKTIIIVALLLVVFIGSISYALWSVTLEQTDSNVVKTGCFTVDMVEQTDEINLPEEYPVLDSEGKTYTPFTFTIQNTCTIDSSYSVNLDVDAATTLEHEYVKVSLNNDAIRVLTDYEKATNEDKYQLTTGTLAGASSEGAGDGESVTYNLRLWLDANTPESQMSKDFIAKVVVENITTTINKQLLATVDYSKTESDDVTVNYYDDGLVEVIGTGAMSSELSGIIPEIINYLLANNSEISKLSAQTPNLSTTAQSFLQVAVMASFGSYKSVTEKMLEGTGVVLDNVTNNEELYDTLVDAINSNSDLFTESDLELIPDMIKTITSEIKQIKSVKISEGITIIGASSFSKFENVQIIFPSTIEEIDFFAFSYAYVDLELNDTLTSIGTEAFAYSRFTTIELPLETNIINLSAFNGSSIESIVIPEGVVGINSGTFNNTPNLTNVVILGNIKYIDSKAFDNLSVNPNLIIKFKMTEDKKDTIKNRDSDIAETFDFTNYNVVWGYTE